MLLYRVAAAFFLLALTASAAPSKLEPQPETQAAPSSGFLPAIHEIAQPRELAHLNELMGKMGRAGADTAKQLAALDESLLRLGEPTKLRGLVQFFRAGLLSEANHENQAIDAIEESIRLLPDYSGPLITAASIYAYTDQPGRGADYLLRAIAKDPASARSIDEYEVFNITRRLRVSGDTRRIQLLSERLLEIGWTGKSLTSSSSLALQAIQRRIADGQIVEARRLVPKLLVPKDSRTLLANKAYVAIWPDVEVWAGTKLEKQWPIY